MAHASTTTGYLIGARREASLISELARLCGVPAFATCAAVVDSVKARLPVWKHQFFADGTDQWVNSA